MSQLALSAYCCHASNHWFVFPLNENPWLDFKSNFWARLSQVNRAARAVYLLEIVFPHDIVHLIDCFHVCHVILMTCKIQMEDGE